MLDNVFDYEKDGNMEDTPYTWVDAHALGNKVTRMTPLGAKIAAQVFYKTLPLNLDVTHILKTL